MHTSQLTQVQVGVLPQDSKNDSKTSSFGEEEVKFQEALLRLCPAEVWPHGSYSAGCPRPIKVNRDHQRELQDLHEALSAAIVDIVQRWWTDNTARFPKLMPLEEKEEDVLKVISKSENPSNYF